MYGTSRLLCLGAPRPGSSRLIHARPRRSLQKPGHGGGTRLYTKGNMQGGVPRIYYAWMKPGSATRAAFEKRRNPYVDLADGQYIYHRDTRDAAEVRATGGEGPLDLYNEHRVVPDIYAEGFRWRHKLGKEYEQWRSNTWFTPDLIPEEHRGRLLCNFYVNVCEYKMKVVKFSPKDHRQWVYCVLYVGSGKGLAGWGRAISPSRQESKRLAVKEAFTNLIGMDLEFDGPVYPVRTNFEGTKCSLFPASRLAANMSCADMCCAMGLWKVGVKINESIGRSKTWTSMCGAVFNCFEKVRSVSELSRGRGKVPHCLVSQMFPYLEELRRRKGMLNVSLPHNEPNEEAPSRKEVRDGILLPTRVIDNRMPDHLKKGYYDDFYWNNFFAGSDYLNESRVGVRGDQLRDKFNQHVQTISNFKGERNQLLPGIQIKKRQSLTSASSGVNRKTLADVLNKINKEINQLGSLPIYNTHRDAKLSTHIKDTFHLHL